MGHPSHLPPLLPLPAEPAGATRRHFFARSGAAGAALAAAPLALAATRVDRRAAPATGAFQHGVASGDPLATRVILWTRVSTATPRPAVLVDWLVATDPALANVVQRGRTLALAERDHTVKVDAAGLRPGTTYYYRFEADGEASPTGRTKTLPLGRVDRLRIAVASCSNHAYGYFNAYRRIAERADLDLVLHLGDYLYEYGPGVYGSVRTPEPPGEMVQLADYRQRHAQYKRDADLQEMHRQHPVITIWDDHEITNDAWVGGAENHTEGAEGAWPERVQQGLQAYYEWMPIRPRSSDRRQNQRAFRLGNLLELVMLEERLQARSQQLPATIPVPGLGNVFVQAGEFLNPERTLLGAEQEAWLAERLRGSRAQWKFLGQGVMFAQLKGQGAPNAAGGGAFLNPDQWDGYQPARDRIYGLIRGDATHPPVADVVVLTGDIHSSWAADLTPDPNNPNVAAGGYDPATGAGSKAVEFVTTSITSPALDDPTGATAAFLKGVNPHFKYIEFNRRGYLLLDVTRERVVGEWWYVPTVAEPAAGESFGAAFEVRAGTSRMAASTMTTPPPGAPAPAP
jgi:alkaline phosphatase D